MNYKEYVSKGAPVKAELATKPCCIKTSWGAELYAETGKHYIVSSIDNPEDRWVVEKEIFEKTYIPATWKKSATVLAYKAEVSGEISTLEGVVEYEAGFYICKGVNGEEWPVPPEEFEKKYITKED